LPKSTHPGSPAATSSRVFRRGCIWGAFGCSVEQIDDTAAMVRVDVERHVDRRMAELRLAPPVTWQSSRQTMTRIGGPPRHRWQRARALANSASRETWTRGVCIPPPSCSVSCCERAMSCHTARPIRESPNSFQLDACV
jgi:hypothetical protein